MMTPGRLQDLRKEKLTKVVRNGYNGTSGLGISAYQISFGLAAATCGTPHVRGVVRIPLTAVSTYNGVEL